MQNDDDPDVKSQDSGKSAPVAGYPAEGAAGPDHRVSASKFNRHKSRILPSPIALRKEYNKLANNPKCGKRGAIAVLAKKYKVSQSAVNKVLDQKQKLA